MNQGRSKERKNDDLNKYNCTCGLTICIFPPSHSHKAQHLLKLHFNHLQITTDRHLGEGYRQIVIYLQKTENYKIPTGFPTTTASWALRCGHHIIRSQG